MNIQLTLDATLESVSSFSQQLEARLERLPLEARTTIVLAIQELLVNVVKHAYAGQPGQIEFALDQADSRLQVVVTDHADNAFQIPERVSAPNPLDLPEHGMGLFIIYQSFDKVQYERGDGQNRWQLVKMLGDAN